MQRDPIRPVKLSQQRREKLRQLLSYSPAAHKLRGRHMEIKEELRRDRRKVWPVARAARLLGISSRLLWQWISNGLLPAYRRPTEHHRKGITGQALRAFLDQLSQAWPYSEPQRRYPHPAQEKCRQALQIMSEEELLTPREFAARAGVSVATVWRATASRNLPALWQTHRLRRICRNPHFHRKNPLTRKSR